MLHSDHMNNLDPERRERIRLRAKQIKEQYMKDSLEFQLSLLLEEWKNSLTGMDFVGSDSVDMLKRRLVRFYDLSIHIDDEELNDFATDVDMFSGG